MRHTLGLTENPCRACEVRCGRRVNRIHHRSGKRVTHAARTATRLLLSPCSSPFPCTAATAPAAPPPLAAGADLQAPGAAGLPAFLPSARVRRPNWGPLSGPTLAACHAASRLLGVACSHKREGRPRPQEGALSPDLLCVPAGDPLVRHVRFLAADGTPLDLSDPRVVIIWQIITPDGVEMLAKKTGDPGLTIV